MCFKILFKVRPEEAVPDFPQHKEIREYLKKAPTKAGHYGLKEVNTNQCWRCKLFGHRTGSKECPYFEIGNLEAEAERQIREDPMALKVAVSKNREKEEKLNELSELLRTVEQEERERKEKKKNKKKKKKKKKKKEGKEEGEKKKRKREDVVE